ncbi:hypothetical protein [Proteiniborus sp. MB09-C3]|uniref:hypothetical protein n=1 Tax=Proteiniborus sp. MB09-C3 TaxID=3050072 RepID=UPI002552DDF1|nr:hypothetical protein [Proteiniborus sp. MB09-C3]WIV13451.1 hypothetical protein QO263_07015 [Proteiniborus sp. MB09-C3]
MFSKDLGIDIEKNIIAKNKIPILTKDAAWLKLFGDAGDKLINNARKELENLLEKQQLTDRQLKEKSREKKRIMNKIIMLSDEINNNQLSGGTDLLGEYQQEIHTLNDEIDNLTFELEMFPKEIKEANLNLIKATIKLAYKQLTEWEGSLEPINLEIEDFRNRLRELIEKKNDYEEKINTTYRFLHGMLGSKEMEKLDKDMLD